MDAGKNIAGLIAVILIIIDVYLFMRCRMLEVFVFFKHHYQRIHSKTKVKKSVDVEEAIQKYVHMKSTAVESTNILSIDDTTDL